MNKLLLLPFLLVSLTGHAEEKCDTHFWRLEGNMAKEVLPYDRFLQSLGSAKDPLASTNDYIKTHGLLFQLNSKSGLVEGYSDYLVGEGSNGYNVGLFMKNLKVRAISNITL